MKTVTTTKYVSHDGREFSTADECKAHEAKSVEGALVGLKAPLVEAAIRRDAGVKGAIALADTIEAIGRQIAQTRIAQGERRRKPKETQAAPPAGQSAAPTGDTPLAGEAPPTAAAGAPADQPAV